jgi:hypothetical protein
MKSFINACGFQYHGPRGYIRFAPKWNKTNFSSSFTSAEGWGTYIQQFSKKAWAFQIQIKYGSLALTSISLQPDLNKIKSIMKANQLLFLISRIKMISLYPLQILWQFQQISLCKLKSPD